MSQNVASTSGADTIVGLGNVFGLEGNDCILGSAELDALFGNEGNDSLLGDAGNDSLDGGKDNDATVGNAGADLEIGGAGADTLFGNQDNDTLYGGLVADDSETSSNVLVGGFGNDLLFATAGDEVLFGNQDDDVIHAGGGIDTVYGGKGNDTVNGDAGDDLLIGGEGSNAIHGGSGVDHAVWAGSASGVYDAAMGAVIVTHDGGVDTVYNDVEQLVWGGVEHSFDSFVPGAAVVDADLIFGALPASDRNANGNWMFGDGTTSGNPANHLFVLQSNNRSVHVDLEQSYRTNPDSIRPRSIAFDGIEATVVTDIAAGAQATPNSSVANPNRGAHNLHWAVGTDNGQTLEQVLTGAGATGDVVVLFEYDRDPTAGTDFFRMQTEIVGGQLHLVDPSTHASFVTDSQRDTDTGANSWNPAAFTPGNSIANHSVGSIFTDRVTIFADLDHDGASDDMLGRVTFENHFG